MLSLESEPDLAQRFGVSRTTLRTAIGELVAQGYLTRSQGRGTFVGVPPTFPLSYPEDPAGSSIEDHSHEMLSVEAAPAKPEQVQRFGWADSVPVLTVTRLGLVHSLPVALCTLTTPSSTVPGIERAEFCDGRYFRILQGLGVNLVRYRLFVESVILTDVEARPLRSRPGLPAICITRHGLTGSGQVVAEVKILLRGDAGRFYLEERFMDGAADDGAALLDKEDGSRLVQ